MSVKPLAIVGMTRKRSTNQIIQLCLGLFGKKKNMDLLRFHVFFVYLQHECKNE